jgi:hypothetical protein
MLRGEGSSIGGAVEALFRRAVSPRPGARPIAGEMAAELSDLLAAARRPTPPPGAPVEDAGDVVIVEAHTDPRVRIARALGAARVPDPSTTPLPPVAVQPMVLTAPFTAPPPYEPPARVRIAAAPASPPGPAPV